MSISNEILGEEKNVQLPPQFTLKIEPYSSKAQGKNKCASDILREERDLQPAHFTLKMESYSSVLDALEGKDERYETGSFDAGGYKWKLILYPQGNKACEGKDHISLYLVTDESNSFPTDNWTVCVNFKLFVLNQKTNKYLTIQDAKGAVRYYDKLRTEHGYAQLLSLDEFNDPCNGYLVNDCCVFGAEVLVIQPSSSSEETIKMVKELDERTYTWSITNFSKSEKSQYSGEFSIGGRKWKLQLYPKGNKSKKGKSLSLYLWLADWESVEPKRKVYAKYKLRVLDHSEVNTIEKPASKWFDSKTGRGYHDFIPLEDIYELSNGYLKNDTLIVEVEFDIISAIKVRP
ncbi:hypothetical protein ACOSP7_004430 [Xanthoceras sorbifolium]|uniref:MATH domain-containing protein n=1 Tax=Xanthoceras sorbifolium TaxID=99658 RepID=A0ABQ8IG73_9ROSI|nr:hypothetical protein JRO89_XS02G0195600 [Xanthoceras sorbifolium]